MKPKSVKSFAPATIGNFCVGFDTLGFAIAGVGDTVLATSTSEKGKVVIESVDNPLLPTDPTKNTATVGVAHFLNDVNAPFGVSLKIRKGIPLGSGLGGSAASAVAGIVAANALLKMPLPKIELLKYALMGEAVASGGAHGDNVAPCLLGGLVLIRSMQPIDTLSIPFPTTLKVVVAHPPLRIDTKESRGKLQPHVPLKGYVDQSANLAAFIGGCYKKDVKLIERSFVDLLIEPQRKASIEGFDDVKKAALEKGALGFTISGSGPTVFALVPKTKALAVQKAMVKAFESHNLSPIDTWISAVNKKGAFSQ